MLYGPLVQWLRHQVFILKVWVRLPQGSPYVVGSSMAERLVVAQVTEVRFLSFNPNIGSNIVNILTEKPSIWVVSFLCDDFFIHPSYLFTCISA